VIGEIMRGAVDPPPLAAGPGLAELAVDRGRQPFKLVLRM